VLLHDSQTQLYPARTPFVITATLHDELSTCLTDTAVIVVQHSAVLRPGKEPHLIRILLGIAPAYAQRTVGRGIITYDDLERYR